ATRPVPFPLADVTFQATRAYALVRVAQFSRNSLYALLQKMQGNTSGTPQRQPVMRLTGMCTMRRREASGTRRTFSAELPSSSELGYHISVMAPSVTPVSRSTSESSHVRL